MVDLDRILPIPAAGTHAAYRQAWIEFIDALARDGRISERQAASGGNPF